MLAGLAVGLREPEAWNSAAGDVDFFDIKADLEALLRNAPVLFEVALKSLQSSKLPEAMAVSKYPHVRRDLAFLVNDNVMWADLDASIRKAAPAIVQSVLPFDVYQGEKVDKGKKSVAIGLILQDFSRTLEEQEVEDEC